MRTLLAIGLGVAALATGCTSPAEVTAARPSGPVIAPGKPGEPAKTLSPDEAATAVPSPTANASDVRFMQDMIIHHRQAIDMALLAPSRARSAELKRFAARIKDAQAPEIAAMTAWLREQGQRVPDHHAGHRGMPGMATPEQLSALRAATGAEFDRLFVELMTAHHRGAIVMARQVLAEGSHVRVRELAEEIAITQGVEIDRLRRIGV
ncbi:DUF305 domain-containing protein [Thermostaphylospora chromogena]|uniref:Uncharacterized conserved protein, DUF305 family n=1 Tax=Thermostaphylospora chromogena TaxID=35622 RepID=A0A1H1EKD5_9ACTN|nr:DUF305 domain-containing protein [Thermostaphylospora chromogena]SDQ89202.1 Uncharacterized conserved protein, DUF305 family [Thermostaphylospora chromogena]